MAVVRRGRQDGMLENRELLQRNSGEHIPALDGVRGLAILLVMLYHFVSYGHGLSLRAVYVDRIFYTICRAGWMGVDLFFVLSGFLITGILYDSKGGAHYFRSFYARRVLRIFPLYFGSLVVFLLLIPRVLPNNVALDAGNPLWYWTYLLNIRIARDGWRQLDALGHFWSLAVEEQFYLLWPLVVLRLERVTLVRVCLFCIGGSLFARIALTVAGQQTAAFVLMPTRLDALAVGAILAVTLRDHRNLTGIVRRATAVAGVAGVLLVAITLWRRGFHADDPVVTTVGQTLLACLFGAVIVLALRLPLHTSLVTIFSSSLLRFFGRYSYGLYVFHHPILFLKPGILPLERIPTVHGSMLLQLVVYIICATTVSLVLALISWHLYEKQFLRLKRFFPYHSSDVERSSSRSSATAAPLLADAADQS